MDLSWSHVPKFECLVKKSKQIKMSRITTVSILGSSEVNWKL